jgi:hypothetical protein
MALTVSPRYDTTGAPPVVVGALGELPAHEDAAIEAMTMKNGPLGSVMPGHAASGVLPLDA